MTPGMMALFVIGCAALMVGVWFFWPRQDYDNEAVPLLAASMTPFVIGLLILACSLP